MARWAVLRAAVLLMLVGPPPRALARRRFSAFQTNGVFSDVAALGSHSQPASVDFSETLADLRYVPPTAAGGLEAICPLLNGIVPDYCAGQFPGLFGHVRGGKLGHAPSRDRVLDICLLAAAQVPSFCRLDAERFHGCKVTRQVVALHDVFVDGGVSGLRDGGSIFDASGNVFPTDPYKNLHSLPKMKVADAQKLLDRARSGDAVVELESAVHAVSTYGGIFYHQWVEVLSWLLFTLPHAPAAGPVLMKAGATAIDGFIEDVLGYGKIEQCAAKDRRKGTCTEPVYTGAKARLLELQDHQLYRVKRLHVHWAGFEPQSPPKQAPSSKPGNCSWYQALPLRGIRPQLHKWLGVGAGAQVAAQRKKTILVIHRQETSRRQISNHQELVAELTRAFPDCVVAQFVGSENTVKASFLLFHGADLVIGPHGAALVFLQAMRPGGAVVELTFRDRRKNSHLTYDFFRLASDHLGLRYGFSMCSGTYDSKLKADIENVVQVSKAVMAASIA